MFICMVVKGVKFQFYCHLFLYLVTRRDCPVFYVIGSRWTEAHRPLGFGGRLNLLLPCKSVGFMSNFPNPTLPYPNSINEQIIIFFLSVLKILFISRERKREREAEKHQCVVASHTPPPGDLALNPGMCPEWELKRQPFGWEAGTQSTEPHQPGLFSFSHFLLVDSLN